MKLRVGRGWPDDPDDHPVLRLEDKVHAWASTLTDDPRLHGFWLRRGVSVETLSALEVGYDRASKRYSIPVRGVGGELLDVKKYKPGAADRKNLHTKDFGSPTRLWGADRLAAEYDPRRPVVFCAGEPDAILLTSLGFLAVTGTSGEGSVPSVDLHLLAGRPVVVCYDADDAGRKGAAKVVAALSRVAAEVAQIELPFEPGEDDKDVTDYLTAGHTTAEFRALVRPLDRADAHRLVQRAVEKARDSSRNEVGFWLACQLRDERYTREETLAAGGRYAEAVTGLKDKPYAVTEFSDSVEQAFSAPARAAVGPSSRGDARVLDHPTEYMPNARRFLADEFDHPDRATLAYLAGELFEWDGNAYRLLSEDHLSARLRLYLEDAVYLDGDGNSVRFKPNASKVRELTAALQALARPPGREVEPPVWLDGSGRADARYISCSNGILRLPDRELLPSSPTFLTLDNRPFDYNPRASRPRAWLDFLRSVFAGDPDSIDRLQEWIGYILSGDTSLQKMALLVGPPRSGKGTITRIVRALVGPENVAAPTMRTLNGEFGAADLIGKALAVVPDARIDKSTGAKELLLAVSGEDPVSINRKNRPHITVRLGTRFMILSNELPRFTDASGAIATRFLVWEFTQSFLGREDPALEARLRAELPGIFNWSLDGLDRLTARGHLLQPVSGRDALRTLTDLSSAIGLFLRERLTVCELGVTPAYPARPDEVWEEWCEWSDAANYPRGSKPTFQSNLRAAVPGLDRRRPGAGTEPGPTAGPSDRPRVYNRIGFQSSQQLSLRRGGRVPVGVPARSRPTAEAGTHSEARNA